MTVLIFALVALALFLWRTCYVLIKVMKEKEALNRKYLHTSQQLNTLKEAYFRQAETHSLLNPAQNPVTNSQPIKSKSLFFSDNLEGDEI